MSAAPVTDLLPGFADPVRGSQAVFRAVMDAMARPGSIHRVIRPLATPARLAHATAALLLTLVDGETPLWLDGQAASAWNWISFHCGAPKAEPAMAQFAVVLDAVVLDEIALDQFCTGSDEAPENSATVMLQVTGFGTGETLRLSGPGLAAENTLTVDGLPTQIQAFLRSNRRLFPRGIDVILCASDEIAALPRTVEIR